MRKRDGVLIISNKDLGQAVGYRLKIVKYILAGVLVSVMFLFNSLIVFSYLDKVEKSKNELNTCLSELDKKRAELKEIYTAYSKVLTIANMKKVVKKVNPQISPEEQNIWVESINKNGIALEDVLNDFSKNRFASERRKESIDLSKSLLLSLGAYESDFRTRTVSGKGAVGGLQLMAVTANYMNVNDRQNIKENINAGINYFIWLLKRFKNNPNQIELAIASYNAGITRVRNEWIGSWGAEWAGIKSELENIGRFNETRSHVDGIMKFTNILVDGSWIDTHPLFWQSFRSFIIADNSIYPDDISTP